MHQNSTLDMLQDLVSHRILLLDGAMGSMIQRHSLDESGFRGERFAKHHMDLRNNCDVVSLTQPQIIVDIHEQYLAAGSDIIETNTFSANAVAQADYGLEDYAYDMNVAAAKLARQAADKFTKQNPNKRRFVAGALGPMNRTLSLSPRVNEPGFRSVTFEQVRDAYADQARGLIDGGVDVLLVETIFDTLNAKAALCAIDDVFAEKGVRIPLLISVTITDKSGRTLSGQTVEAFWTSVSHAKPFSVGINCALGALEMRPFIAELARVADVHISCYPNAGLPNAFGEYDETPAQTGAFLAEFADAGLVDLVGGCCGTTPDHIHAIGKAVEQKRTHQIQVPADADKTAHFSGLEPLNIGPDTTFLLIGERTNVTGSKRFADLIKAGDFQTALEVALDQVRGGANLLDVNMDEGMLDSEAAMTLFLNLIASEPEISRIPIMIDSSKWSVIEAGLKCVQGKGIVNSISLKEGEADFLAKARRIKYYGAGMVVMAFDEKGQADTTQRKVEICERAYKLLTEVVGVNPQDIVFDPNILAIATGMDEHSNYAVNFIEATSIIKKRCRGARISGGVSNLSFSFRGNNAVREAMNSAFLFHAIQAGMDMGIVNAGQVVVYSEIDKALLVYVEDVIFNRRADATERLVEYAAQVKGGGKKREYDLAWREQSVQERISHALVTGTVDFIEQDVAEALTVYAKPLHIIEGPMMAGMTVVGDLFGAGKMFLPQVVKSARVMKKGVAYLLPLMEAERLLSGDTQTYQGKILMATVKGDVHDIGKNIVGVVLGCNNYEVIDLGVMVGCDRILDEAQRIGADMVGLSGLITPSLDEMVYVAKEMQRRHMTIPLLIGGATTSKQHTAVKIAQQYSQPVVHVLDASRAVNTVSSLMTSHQKEQFQVDNLLEQERLRQAHFARQDRPLLSLQNARAKKPQLDWTAASVTKPEFLGRIELRDVAVAEIVPYIDWTFLFIAWELKGKFPRILQHAEYGEQARELYDNALQLLKRIIDDKLLTCNAVYGFWPAQSDGDDIVLYTDETRTDELMRFNMLRQQQLKIADKPHLSLADFVAPLGTVPDYVGAFAVTAGIGTDAIVEYFQKDHDDYNAIMLKALADRLAEAFAEMLHARARKRWYAPAEAWTQEELIAEKFRGIRPAFGYPACPDHSEKRKLWQLLKADDIGIHLTETLAMTPAASVSGLYLGHPQADYFMLGKVDAEQMADYARRKGVPVAEIEQALANTVADNT